MGWISLGGAGTKRDIEGGAEGVHLSFKPNRPVG